MASAKESSAKSSGLEDFVGGQSPNESAAKPEAQGSVKEKKPQAIKYHSRREQFGACVRSRVIHRDGNGRVVREEPAKYVQFHRNMLETDDPEIIKWLDTYINDPNTPKDEVFRMPEIDELLSEGLTNRLDSMSLDELRAAARERNIEVRPTDDEVSLRYKLLKLLSGFGATTKSK